MKKSITTSVLLLILSFIAVSIPEINKVKAENRIYIRSDGSVEKTNEIQRDGNVFTFTDNINGSIIVESDNIVIDGAGFILQGTGSLDWVGVDISFRNNVTVNNIVTRLCGYDIRLSGSSNCIISDIVVERRDMSLVSLFFF